MVRPSLSETQRESAVKFTLETRSSGLRKTGICRFYRIAIRFAQAYTSHRNSDPCGLRERHPTATGATSHEVSGTEGLGGNA